MPHLIIGLVGTAGSGKSHAASYMSKRYGGRIFKFSEYLSQVLDILAIPKSRDNLIKLSVALRKEFGENALAYAVARGVLSTEPVLSEVEGLETGMTGGATLAIVDGIRRVDDVAPLEPLPNFVLVAIDADPKLRFDRMKRRGEKAGESLLTWEQFMMEERAPTEVTIPEVIKRAKVRIANEGTVAELEAKIDDLMKHFDIKKNLSFRGTE
ncbi:hypothetical protein A3E39_00945 [Candidatus Uhrbacteria bacterium RIFCSPHIGHO2_12_FULL_60_25]|uniref:Dephospho-CoA kinase n=1 Tax=Candidatus Uhrbacteria bacterium RIFCSPHIGHO2_12_FULL_60_25 TaxID=1802399 RepID=A0A1F7UN37_9BACT|nr:MAG: hypothetical protein A3D73_02855 [Candidatus Uhrbacteria bacterium RIFCSPHIGHO2_02_FULL_60_44]OGL79669.1 MAG: hypothetical protein A3E39_00945 [Candidatus Uhrbacteria bacterium RIFCSPHIGHO2_12_FULL_60_25]